MIRKDEEAARAPRDPPAAGARASSLLALATAPTACPNEQGEVAAPELTRTACPVSEASYQDQRQTEAVDMRGPPSMACEPSLISDGGISPQGRQGHEQGTKAHPAESGLQPNQSTTHKQAGTGDVQEVLTQPDLVVSDGEQGTPVSQRRQPQAPPPPQDSASAQRRFKVFARRVKKPLATPLLKKPSPTKTPSPRRPPLRSRRIAAQTLSRIPTAKRGEYLVLKRLGHASAITEATVDSKFDALFGGKPEDDEALRELFPEGRTLQERRRRRRAPRQQA